MQIDVYSTYDCDLCGSSDAEEIEITKRLQKGHPLHVCRNCGFVYVRRRRKANRIAEVWSDNIFKVDYVPRIPAVVSRHIYVAEFITSLIGAKNKQVCDLGAGTGQFLDIIRRPEYGATPFGIEPSADNCRIMENMGIEAFCGTAEDYSDTQTASQSFDIVSLLWTVENCNSCRSILNTAHDMLADGGYVVMATGSRILVPFRKPLHYYLGCYAGTSDIDTHCFRFSANSMRNLLELEGFKVVHVNRYIDTDYLVMIGKKTKKPEAIDWHRDNYKEVVNFFERWDADTRKYYADS